MQRQPRPFISKAFISLVALCCALGFVLARVAHKPDTQVYGLLVNHHLFAGQLIENEFKKVASDVPRVVVLFSPNHFYAGQGNVQTTDRVWHMHEGTVYPQADIVHALYASRVANIDDTTFDQEHGVYNILPYIYAALPHAQVVPVIFKDNTPPTELEAVVQRLNELLPPDALIVGSFDFSHYSPVAVSEFHDALSLSVIHSFDLIRANDLDIDSIPGFKAFLMLLKIRGAEHFTLGANTSATKLINQPWNSDNTSYITGSFTHGASVPDGVVTELRLPILPNNHNEAELYAAMPRLLSGQDIKHPVIITHPTHAVGVVHYSDHDEYKFIPLLFSNNTAHWPNESESGILLHNITTSTDELLIH